MRWDEWRGSMDGRPTLWVRWLFSRPGRFHIDLHKMVAKDDADCFHTHPAYAIRVVLCGGYVEEMEDGSHRMWRPGMVGDRQTDAHAQDRGAAQRPGFLFSVDHVPQARGGSPTWWRVA